jgi:hypothetical protein
VVLPVIPALTLGRLSLENHEFEANLGYKGRSQGGEREDLSLKPNQVRVSLRFYLKNKLESRGLRTCFEFNPQNHKN